MTTPSDVPEPSRQAFSYPSYRFFWLRRISPVSRLRSCRSPSRWQIYHLTGDAFYLGWSGLALFLPALLLVLVTGLTADRFNRRIIHGHLRRG